MQKFLLFSLLTILLFSCADSVTVQQHKLEDANWEAMMANHDVVMPMMGTTHKVRKELQAALKNQENLPGETIETINELVKNLDDADDAMMTWMNTNGGQKLEKIQKSMTHQEILQYITEQDVSIKNVGKNMTNGIKKGMDFLETANQNQAQ